MGRYDISTADFAGDALQFLAEVELEKDSTYLEALKETLCLLPCRYTSGKRAVNERGALVDEPIHPYHTSEKVRASTALVPDPLAASCLAGGPRIGTSTMASHSSGKV